MELWITTADVAKTPKLSRDGLVSTQIPPEVNRALDEFCERTVRPKRAVITRVLSWFLRCDDRLKTALVDGTDVGMEDAYATMLEDAARRLRGKAKGYYEQGAAQITLRVLPLAQGGTLPDAERKEPPPPPPPNDDRPAARKH